VAYDRLYHQPCERRCQPEAGYGILSGAEGLKYTAHVGALQRKSYLDAQKSKTHIEYLPKTQTRFLLHDFLIIPKCNNKIKIVWF
jgi:hypothetical protein